MPVTYGATGGGAYYNAGTSIPYNHTVASDDNAILIALQCDSPQNATMSVGSTNVPLLAYNANLAVFGKIGIPTGTQSISGTSVGGHMSCNSVSYKNVEAFGTPIVQTSGGSITATATSNDMVFYTAGCYVWCTNVISSPSHTQRWLIGGTCYLNQWNPIAYAQLIQDCTGSATLTCSYSDDAIAVTLIGPATNRFLPLIMS